MYIIVALLPGCQSSILSSNKWHNDMNPAFISTIMAPNFKIEEIASGTSTLPSRGSPHGDKIRIGYQSRAFSGVPNRRGQNQKWLHHLCLLGGPKMGGLAT